MCQCRHAGHRIAAAIRLAAAAVAVALAAVAEVVEAVAVEAEVSAVEDDGLPWFFLIIFMSKL